MNSYEKKELAITITIVVGIVMVLCTGILAISKNASEVNKIEATCYASGGHMEKVPYSTDYLTCKDQKR